MPTNLFLTLNGLAYLGVLQYKSFQSLFNYLPNQIRQIFLFLQAHHNITQTAMSTPQAKFHLPTRQQRINTPQVGYLLLLLFAQRALFDFQFQWCFVLKFFVCPSEVYPMTWKLCHTVITSHILVQKCFTIKVHNIKYEQTAWSVFKGCFLNTEREIINICAHT